VTRHVTRSRADGTGDSTAVEAVLRDWIGLDPSTVGSSAIDRATRIRMAAIGEHDAAAYAARLQDDAAERQQLVEEVVVGESWFFRDSQVFAFVTDLAVTRAGLPGHGPLRVLCAPCAGGEEPFSVAMALLDAGLAADQFAIDAVDVSHTALERAHVGRYSANAFRNADCSFRERWFRPDGTGSIIDAAVRACVRFSVGNLVDDSFAAGRERYDVIFCRNLLIYLTSAARRRVEATLDGDTVDSLRLKLADPLSVDQLSGMFQIGDLASVSVLDESGVSIGEVFPEVGLIFSLKPGTRSALAVMIEPLDPEAFVLRAEGELQTDTAVALADLKFAVTLDPQHLRARRMLLVLLCEQGKWEAALELADATEAIDPDDVWTRLKGASIVAALGRFDDARERLAAVKTLPRLEGVGSAQVERMLGRIAIECDRPDPRAAVRHFEAAIRAATPLKTARSESVRDAARDVLLDTHLGMAVAIAKGEWQRKGEVVAKWLAAATKIVESVDDDAPERPLMEIQLCRGALAAATACETVDPLPWVKRLLVTRDGMSAGLSDPWRRRQVDWETGRGLADALTSAQRRGEGSDALDNATLTVAYLERGAEWRDLTDAERGTIGDLLFRIGVLHSLQHGDHATAVTWFDKVRPYWKGNDTHGAEGDVGRLGESYVSMAVSYWQVDRREDALDLCRRGIDCMVSAVDAKQLDEPALALAYDNLSKMYAELGEDERSRTYAEMASRAEASGQRR